MGNFAYLVVFKLAFIENCKRELVKKQQKRKRNDPGHRVKM